MGYQMIPGPAFSWESQAEQYAWRAEPGIALERHHRSGEEAGRASARHPPSRTT
jgi:hypothetical protein